MMMLVVMVRRIMLRMKVVTSNCKPDNFSLFFFSSVTPNLVRGSTKRAIRTPAAIEQPRKMPMMM